MNREIEFRGKDKDNEWIYGYYHKEISTSLALQEYGINEIVTHYIHTVINHIPLKVNVKSETIGQYTGLKDKNGIKVYEGDIVMFDYKWTKSNETGVVTWNKDNSSFQIKGHIPSSSMKHLNQMKVIGNIYENEENK